MGQGCCPERRSELKQGVVGICAENGWQQRQKIGQIQGINQISKYIKVNKTRFLRRVDKEVSDTKREKTRNVSCGVKLYTSG